MSEDDLRVAGRVAFQLGAATARDGTSVVGYDVDGESVRQRTVAPGLGTRVRAATDRVQSAAAGSGGDAYHRAIRTYRRAIECYRRALDLAEAGRATRTSPPWPGQTPSPDDAAGAGAAVRQPGTVGVRPKPEHAPSPSNPAAAMGWGPLTRRERDVARLVADGLSNREIATALVLVEGTVANHLRRLRLRLGLRSRAQVAAWVAVDDARRRPDAPVWPPDRRALGWREPLGTARPRSAERADDAPARRRPSA